MHIKCLDERVVARAKRRGVDVLVYAPHFTRLPTIRARADRFSDDELLVVPARELFTGPWNDRNHLLAIGLSEPVPDFITIEGALAECRRQEAAVLVPHPSFLNVSLGRAEVATFRDELHAVETYNGKCFPHQNRRSSRIAAEFDKPGFGSSYAHLRGNVGEAWTEFDRRIDTEAALATALREDVPRRIDHRPGLGHRVRNLAEFAHLGYENTWGKIDRLLLSGTEPTHPRQLVYEGRFDDVTVY
ncbi:PHP-associated domain-containing protein [Haloprofundus halobius]|uniref:PHP-associated domain-containing protein n=1 Tax=Haloprofundus halobius TaxID=2876194 RepID=UPI001CCCC77B|nr:PHP-associated domain-containing protein [Haloprofundus halobius]